MRKLFIGLILSFLLILSACKERPFEGDYRVLTVQSEKELKEILSKNNYNYDHAKGDLEMLPGDATNEDTNALERSYSKTNVQVEGVDEGDIVKTDGNRIYMASYQTFKVIEIDNGEMELIFEDKIDEYNYYFEMYVTDRYAILIGSSYSYSYCDFELVGEQKLTIDIYDITSKVEFVKQISMTGYYNTSRLVDNKLYLIANYWIYNTKEIARPAYFDGSEEIVPDFADIKYIPALLNNYYTVFATVVLDEEISTTFDTFLGFWGGTVYMNTESIYYAFYNYNKNKTDIVRYGINKNNNHVDIKGCISVEGYILNQFSMDEYDGYFRVVTTADWWGQSNNPDFNYLFVFKIAEKAQTGFELVGTLNKGIGKPGERVMSVRFNEDEVSIVTFRQIDPLYIIDLSVPEKPTIVSELEIPGYSSYQHHWDEDTIIGIGFNVENNMTNGIKVSLFDSSEGLKEVATLIFPGYAEATYNHKAILIDKEHNIFGFGVNEYNYSNYYWYYNPVYYLIQVDKDGPEPLKIVGKIAGEYENKWDDNYGYAYTIYNEVIRMINIDDYYYAVSYRNIRAYRFIDGTLTLVNRIKIGDFQDSAYWWYCR